MTTYADYQKQIAELENLAEEARKSDLAKAREQIRNIMNEYGLTFADLERPSKGASKVRKPVEVKYRDDSTGHTWTGRGRAPKWLEGKKKEEYLIQP